MYVFANDTEPPKFAVMVSRQDGGVYDGMHGSYFREEEAKEISAKVRGSRVVPIEYKEGVLLIEGATYGSYERVEDPETANPFFKIERHDRVSGVGVNTHRAVWFEFSGHITQNVIKEVVDALNDSWNRKRGLGPVPEGA